MKLTPLQIQELYKFTRKHYVEHYDLQTELVDHLANGIEKSWEENPRLSFDESLALEFKKFGVFGFSEVVEKYDKALTKKYFKIVIQFMSEYVKLPTIIGTICAIIAVFYCIRTFSFSEWIVGSLSFASMLYMAFSYIQLSRKYNQKLKKTGQRWKLEELIFKTGNGVILAIYIPQIIYQTGILNVENTAVQLLTSIVIIVAIIFTHINLHILPKKAEKLLCETYPEYKLLA